MFLTSCYSTYILPRLIDWAMGDKTLAPLRASLLAPASGTVAEFGFGSGTNVPFYPTRVKKLIAVDPSKELFERAKKRIATFKGEFEHHVLSADRVPLEKHSVDFVVCAFTLCSVASTMGLLQEARRILKPGGEFLFLEHGLAPDASVQTWQHRLTPLQKRIAGGCHLNRNILGVLADACWDVTECRRFYAEGIPKPLGYFTVGRAQYY